MSIMSIVALHEARKLEALRQLEARFFDVIVEQCTRFSFNDILQVNTKLKIADALTGPRYKRETALKLTLKVLSRAFEIKLMRLCDAMNVPQRVAKFKDISPADCRAFMAIMTNKNSNAERKALGDLNKANENAWMDVLDAFLERRT